LVLSEYAPPLVPIQIICVANRLLSKRAIVFMDFMTDVFSKIPAFGAAGNVLGRTAPGQFR